MDTLSGKSRATPLPPSGPLGLLWGYLYLYQYKINNVVKELQTSFTMNSLVLNAKETLAISFHSIQNKKPVLPHVTLKAEIFQYNTEAKFLGIHIYENMKWNNHVKYVSSKLIISYYMISSLENAMSPYVLRTMYFACFHVHLRYGLTLWGSDPESINIV
jgi:hypothetical protein